MSQEDEAKSLAYFINTSRSGSVVYFWYAVIQHFRGKFRICLTKSVWIVRVIQVLWKTESLPYKVNPPWLGRAKWKKVLLIIWFPTWVFFKELQNRWMNDECMNKNWKLVFHFVTPFALCNAPTHFLIEKQKLWWYESTFRHLIIHPFSISRNPLVIYHPKKGLISPTSAFHPPHPLNQAHPQRGIDSLPLIIFTHVSYVAQYGGPRQLGLNK